MALEEETKKAKAKTNGNGNGGIAAAPGLDPKEREAMFAEDESDWAETGQRWLFKPDAFVCSVVGEGAQKVERCWRIGPDGKKVFSAPLIVGTPYAVVNRDHSDYGEYGQVCILLTKSTIVMKGEGDSKYEEVVPAGMTLLITLTAGLERLAKIAEMENEGIECRIRAIQKEPIKGGKQTWRYSIKENPVRITRVRSHQLPPAEFGTSS